MLGGLLHDVGEVYIQPEYLDHGTALDSVGHKHLVVHPRVAQMLLDVTTDYPKALCLAIGEHHERLDGSGYPARLSGQQLSPLGRLLAVVEVTMGLLRNPQAPLNRASFALRVVPGEFDPQWGGQVSDMARAAGEVLPPAAAHSRAEQLLPMTLIDRRLHQTQELAQTLKNQGRTEPFFDILETALLRLNRLRVAWNALGFWGLDASQLSCQEAFELQLAGAELQQRLRALQRECMLLCERLGELEKTLLEPLWHGLLDGRVKV
ncbi:MAG: HD domain-containing protein [Rhodoferax sp.]|nr:HD domain-containing protein [Rhodoferax sp.]